VALHCSGTTTTGGRTTTTGSPVQNFSVCGFVCIYTSQTDFTAIFTCESSVTGMQLETALDGLTFEFSPGGGGLSAVSSGIAAVLGTWYFVALTIHGSGATGCIAALYVKPVGGGSLQRVNGSGFNVSGTPTALDFGEDNSGGGNDSYLNGALAGWRYWSGTILSQADFELEAESIRSYRMDRTYEWSFDNDADLRDRRQSNLLTVTAAQVSAAAGPPVPYWPQRTRPWALSVPATAALGFLPAVDDPKPKAWNRQPQADAWSLKTLLPAPIGARPWSDPEPNRPPARRAQPVIDAYVGAAVASTSLSEAAWLQDIAVPMGKRPRVMPDDQIGLPQIQRPAWLFDDVGPRPFPPAYKRIPSADDSISVPQIQRPSWAYEDALPHGRRGKLFPDDWLSVPAIQKPGWIQDDVGPRPFGAPSPRIPSAADWLSVPAIQRPGWFVSDAPPAPNRRGLVQASDWLSVPAIQRPGWIQDDGGPRPFPLAFKRIASADDAISVPQVQRAGWIVDDSAPAKNRRGIVQADDWLSVPAIQKAGWLPGEAALPAVARLPRATFPEFVGAAVAAVALPSLGWSVSDGRPWVRPPLRPNEEFASGARISAALTSPAWLTSDSAPMGKRPKVMGDDQIGLPQVLPPGWLQDDAAAPRPPSAYRRVSADSDPLSVPAIRFGGWLSTDPAIQVRRSAQIAADALTLGRPGLSGIVAHEDLPALPRRPRVIPVETTAFRPLSLPLLGFLGVDPPPAPWRRATPPAVDDTPPKAFVQVLLPSFGWFDFLPRVPRWYPRPPQDFGLLPSFRAIVVYGAPVVSETSFLLPAAASQLVGITSVSDQIQVTASTIRLKLEP